MSGEGVQQEANLPVESDPLYGSDESLAVDGGRGAAAAVRRRFPTSAVR